MTPRPIDEAIARLQEHDDVHVLVTQTALFCWHHTDHAARLRALWELCAVGREIGRTDALSDLYETAKANQKERPA